ncbi:bifunctional riboflavin kinase/FAD synthetase [Lachnospiraceae bacterium ZAX-1]
MEYIKNTTKFQMKEPTVLSLGKFDGLHMGHKYLIDYVLKKKKEGLKAVIFTFDMPPKSLVGQSKQQVITTNEEKIHLFDSIGIDCVIECPFTTEIMRMEPENFIKMLVEQLNVVYLAAGKDFHFGHKRRGDYNMLLEYGKQLGFEVEVVEKKQFENRDISSTFIREEIAKGHMERANMLLGYEFFVQGVVEHGRKLGRRLGIPTLNLVPSAEKVLPPFGVYVTQTIIDKQVYDGITNVGKKPTIEIAGGHPVGVETHVFDYDADAYGKEIKVNFLAYSREEKKFDSIDDLKNQMENDIKCGKSYLKAYKRRYE